MTEETTVDLPPVELEATPPVLEATPPDDVPTPTVEAMTTDPVEGVYSLELAAKLPLIAADAPARLFRSGDANHITKFSMDYGVTLVQVVVVDGALAIQPTLE